jgi:hypothetical protein
LKGIEDFNLEHLHPTQRAEVECIGYLVLKWTAREQRKQWTQDRNKHSSPSPLSTSTPKFQPEPSVRAAAAANI